jgi:hypothetical protein
MLEAPPACDGDKSPAESADKSAHSKACGGGFAALGFLSIFFSFFFLARHRSED